MSTEVRRGIACAGNWIVDLVNDIPYWPNEGDLVHIERQFLGVGGGAANVISDLSSLNTGIPLTPVGKIGIDAHADVVLAHCRDFGLPVQMMQQVQTLPTGHTSVMNVPGHSRSFFYRGGANDGLSQMDVPIQEIADSGTKIFYLGYLMLLAALDRLYDNTTDAAAVLKGARQAGMLTCVDVVSVDSPDFEAIVNASIPHVDYLFVNDIEAARACGDSSNVKEHALPQHMQDHAQQLLERGVNAAVIAHSDKGAVWVGRDSAPLWVESVETQPEDIVSTVGAGDAFCAGCLYGIHEDWSPERCLTLAHATACASLRGRTASEAIPSLHELIADP